MPLDLSSMMPERLAALDALVGRSQEVLEAASQKARGMLRTGEEFGWEFVPLASLPEGIESAGLFVLPALSRPTPHRHPNSTQHMRRLRGEGRVRITLGEEVLERSVGPDEPWIVIEADATHQIDVGAREFVVISFHTVPQEELLEVTETGQRHY
jgi:quercetin dioxygenase-like cupin family protein